MREERKLDIYDFIPSPDVATHCRKTGHQFSPIEMAKIIDCSGKTMAACHDDLRALMRDYPDIPLTEENTGWYDLGLTLHECLRKKIEEEEGCLADFRVPGKDVYYQADMRKGDMLYNRVFRGRERISGQFSTFEQALEQVLQAKQFGWEQAKIMRVTRVKEDSWNRSSICVNCDGEMLSVEGGTECIDFFRHIPLKLPIPFSRGDIVTLDGVLPVAVYDIANSGRPGDNADQFYVIEADGEICKTSLFLEYGQRPRIRRYTGELKGPDRFLKDLGRYAKMLSRSVKRQGR